MITILDKNGNKIMLHSAYYSRPTSSGQVEFFSDSGELNVVAVLHSCGEIYIFGNAPHTIEPAIKPTIDSILFDLTQPSNRRQFSEAKLGKLKRILQQFDSKKLQWKKGTENQIIQ